MPGARIKNWQRQAQELGRIRAGEVVATKDGKNVRPTSAKTWILTSPTREYLDAAAALQQDGEPVFGGTVEQWQPQGKGAPQWRLVTAHPYIDVWIPPGDPVSQYHEMWTAGGCQRRCDGERELLTDQPCLCFAAHGENWHEMNRPPKGKPGTVCSTHTRVNVFIPALPDVGFWRLETQGFWAGNRIPGAIDIIKGTVGDSVLLPVRFQIVPRTRTQGGQTSQYIEIVMQMLALTMGQLVAGDTAGLLALTPGQPRAAIEGGPIDEREQLTLRLVDRITASVTREEMMSVKRDIEAAGLAEKLGPLWSARAKQLASGEAQVAQDQENADAEAVWSQITGKAGKQGWDTGQLTRAAGTWLSSFHKTDLWSATAAQLREFEAALVAGKVEKPA